MLSEYSMGFDLIGCIQNNSHSFEIQNKQFSSVCKKSLFRGNFQVGLFGFKLSKRKISLLFVLIFSTSTCLLFFSVCSFLFPALQLSSKEQQQQQNYTLQHQNQGSLVVLGPVLESQFTFLYKKVQTPKLTSSSLGVL